MDEPRRAAARMQAERGAVTIWVLLVVGGLVSMFAAVVYDGGNAANRHTEIADAAWALARTAAAETTFQSGGGGLGLDETAARAAVTAHAAQQWPDLIWVLTINGDQATVRVTGDYQTRLLKAVGITEWTFEADRTATAKSV